MNLEALIVSLYLNYLNRTLRVFAPNPEWQKLLKNCTFASLAVLVLEIFFKIENVTVWLWQVAEFAIVMLVFRMELFSQARRTLIGLLPLMILLFLENATETFAPALYNRIDRYISIAQAIALTWLVAMIFLSKKENKALEKERQKRLREEERHRIIEEQKAQLENQVVERTLEITRQKEALENALIELQATQKQLIQSEKMASLGELTAGIAHEIQNPLNFVNNFSEVSVELINELKDEIKAGNSNAVNELADDIEKNLHKITHHGKRADAIVKGMLQHSRSSTGNKEPTDINDLADEYLRLSYHGLRAKDKNFNAVMQTFYEPNLGLIYVIPQDIGRVLLNMFTNAFYSVTDKRKKAALRGTEYNPTVSVATRLIKDADEPAGKVRITVRDNGMGIPQQVIEKIYQPFFTTKPSGEGTGLGLSLSYDIIKAHNGTLDVKTREGEFAEFIIDLPALRS